MATTADVIPLFDSLEQVYTADLIASQKQRFDELSKRFASTFGHQQGQVRFTRAPGRINLIGEHVDTSDFSVLPSALERDILIAYAPMRRERRGSNSSESSVDTLVELHSALPGEYEPVSFEANLSGDGSDIVIAEEHSWANYIKAGFKGLLAYLASPDSTPPVEEPSEPPQRLCCLVSGTIPPRAGLSSSSALTIASVITAMSVLGLRQQLSRKEITTIAIESERAVGINSGGMDQTASCFSEPNHVLHVEFVPELEARLVKIPRTRPAMSFVVANTLVTSDKKVTARTNYNLRVAEIRLGVLLLAQHLRFPVPQLLTDAGLNEPVPTYKSVLDAYFASMPHTPAHTPAKNPERGATLPTFTNGPTPALPSSRLAPPTASHEHELKLLLNHAAVALGGPGKERGETWEQIMDHLGVPESDPQRRARFWHFVTGSRDVEPLEGRFRIWRRARHVLTEALRVYQLKDTFESGPATMSDDQLLERAAELMNQSQQSCREDFECSCPELDDMVALALRNGALACRITGAGWGGCTVSLVPEPQVPQLIQALRELYYAKRFPKLTEDELKDACFATKPVAGACVVQPASTNGAT